MKCIHATEIILPIFNFVFFVWFSLLHSATVLRVSTLCSIQFLACMGSYSKVVGHGSKKCYVLNVPNKNVFPYATHQTHNVI